MKTQSFKTSVYLSAIISLIDITENSAMKQILPPDR